MYKEWAVGSSDWRIKWWLKKFIDILIYKIKTFWQLKMLLIG